MNLCVITRDPNEVGNELTLQLAAKLQVCVAQALNVVENETFRVTPDDVQIAICDTNPFDGYMGPLTIQILADYCPEREADLEGRMVMVRESIVELLPRKIAGPLRVWAQMSQKFHRV